MDRNDFFGFEDKNQDFPLYNEKSFYSKNNLRILLISVLLFMFLTYGPVKFQDGQQQIIFFLVMLIPLLLFTGGKLGSFFRRPSLDDFRLIIVSYICYQLYYIFIVALLGFIGFQTTQGSFVSSDFPILLTNILQIIAEEILKVFIFILSMYVIYRYTKDRKKALIISCLITLIIFGLLHYNTYPNIIQILLIQGLGGIFELFGYIKTKNLAVSTLIHLLINLSGWIALMMR